MKNTKMTLEQFVIEDIQHTEGYPDLGEISLESAQFVVDNFRPSSVIPEFTAEEYRDMWNKLIHDPEVMSEGE